MASYSGVALGSMQCAKCGGLGVRKSWHREVPCRCTLRNLCRMVLARYRREELRLFCTRTWRRWSRAAEFKADVFLAARSVLSDAEFIIFREFFIEGREWHEINGRLGLDRGNFFHAVYRIEARVGKLYAELRPFPLFPTDQYFLPTIRRDKISPSAPEKISRPALKPPVRPVGERHV